MSRRRLIFLALAFAFSVPLGIAGCGPGAEPFDSKLPPPFFHYFACQGINKTKSDLYIDIYFDDHYYGASLVPAQGSYPLPFASFKAVGPYDYMPHRVIVNGRLPDAPSVQWNLAQYRYYGVDYGIATIELIVEIVPPPPPSVVSGG